ncbi:MAG: trypsin-like peptidase domain-containing protein [Myxococcales bacterium]|nr:trypsin-like peptidase domain-containing protein [Myxococcales bacterium]MDD9965478.1 trypsin-like peptidase domain-containing protein [Myxococcales bacterium]
MPRSLDRLAKSARTAIQAVVQIHAYGFNHASVTSILDPRYPEPGNWRGSGFLVDIPGEEGLILTNAHVVRNALRLQVMSPVTSDELFHAETVGLVTSLEPDIAAIRLTEDSLTRFRDMTAGEVPKLPLGDSDTVERGHQVKAIGYPFGMMEPNVSGGEISNFIAGDSEYPERLVTNAAINPGNSGGPAVEADGSVLGLNTSVIADADNIGFITPVEWVRILLPQLLAGGDAKLADVAAYLQPNSPENADHLGLSEPMGLITMRVFEGGMLAQAGLERLDVLTAIDGVPIDRFGNLRRGHGRRRSIYDAVRNVPVGERISLEFVRRGRREQVEALAAPRPLIDVPSRPVVADRHFVELQGLVIQELSLEIANAIGNQTGTDYLASVEGRPSPSPRLVVTFVMPGSPGDELFFSPGTIIVRVNGEPVGSVNELVAAAGRCGATLIVETQLGGLGTFRLSEEEQAEIAVRRPPVG